jgi:hypothetical protein
LEGYALLGRETRQKSVDESQSEALSLMPTSAYYDCMCPNPGVFESGHFAGFNGGLEHVESIPNLLNLSSDQFVLFWQ